MPPKKSNVRQALGQQLHADKYVQPRNSAKRLRDNDGSGFSGGTLTENEMRKIMKHSRRHQEEDNDNEEEVDSDEAGADGDADVMKVTEGDEDGEASGDDDDELIDYDDAASEVSTNYDPNMTDELIGFEDVDFEDELSAEEMRLLGKLNPAGQTSSRTLADIIMEKFREKKEGVSVNDGDESVASDGTSNVDKRVRKVYIAIGRIMKSYTSGKIPKAFKALPHIQNWETLLLFTAPHEWSPHATYAATRIFAAHLNEKMAQRFYYAFLLPIVHDAMSEQKKLHPALFNALRKALFKPVAFYKGFLLPLASEGECTLREAMAVGAVLQKMHLPPVPTAVALYKISELPFSSATTLFLRVMINKKMALPYQVIDALVKYFHRFSSDHNVDQDGPLPVLWHQTFLSFVQHYRNDLLPEQIELLRQVCTAHFHHLITPEVRREIAAAQGLRSSMH